MTPTQDAIKRLAHVMKSKSWDDIYWISEQLKREYFRGINSKEPRTYTAHEVFEILMLGEKGN